MASVIGCCSATGIASFAIMSRVISYSIIVADVSRDVKGAGRTNRMIDPASVGRDDPGAPLA